jgi:ATP-binding cassette subfamily A (ABC1) protein 3
MQFGGLLKKDFLLWRRNIVGTICEMIFPLLFTLLLLYLNTLVETNDVEAVSSVPFIMPTNDELVASTFFANGNLFKDCSDKNRKGGRVAIVPENDVTKKLTPLFQKLNYETVFLESREKAEEMFQSSDYTEPFDNSTWRQFCFLIEFSKAENKQYEYALRYNVSGPWPRKDHWDTIEEKPYIPFVKDSQDSYQKMFNDGIFLLKNYIDNHIFEHEVNKKLTVGIERFKVEPYTTSNLYDILPIVVSVLIIFILIFPFIRIISQVVTDRETLVLQNMENMGMKKYVYFWSTLVFFYIKSFFIVLIISLLIKFTVFKDIGFFFIFFMFLFGSYCYINLGFFISCFFIHSKKAIITGIVIFFALNLGSALLASSQDSKSLILFLTILSPNINLEVIKDAMLRAQTNFATLTLGNIDNLSFNIPLYTLFIILIVQFIVYILLGLYCFYVGKVIFNF